MRNADYWRGRFSILEDNAHREAQRTIQDMEELYLDAQRSVQKEIESWYARFAVNNQISLTDARKWLTAGQLEEFHWSVEQYIKIGEQAGLDAAWLKKLENASAQKEITVLEHGQTHTACIYSYFIEDFWMSVCGKEKIKNHVLHLL